MSAIPEFLELSDEQREIQGLARDFATEHIAPHAAQWDRDAQFDRRVVAQLGELGFLGMLLPEEYGGLALDSVTYLLAIEELALADASTALLVSVHNSLPTRMILARGSPEQKDRFLRPMARGDLLGAFALSEPDAGSDASSLTAQAVRDGACYVINGTKAWVTCGAEAGVIVAMVRTDTPGARRGARGISAFIVTPDLPGFHVGRKEDKMGMRASPTVQLVFDNLRVPAANLLGEPGAGFVYAMNSLEHGRLGIAAQALGIARAAFEHSVRYAAERKQFGKAIKEHEAIQFKLADMATRVASARALLYAAAAAKDRGRSRDSACRHGQADGERDSDVGDDASCAGIRRVRVHNRLSRRAALSRRQSHRDLRGYVGDPARRNRARVVRGTIGVVSCD